MRITFLSNYLNHHQLPFCLEMGEKFGENFKFVATVPVPEERLSLGYENMNDIHDSFVLKTYEIEAPHAKIQKVIDDSDVVIIGSAPISLIKNRLENGKLVFRYMERVFKGSRNPIYNPKLWISMFIKHTLFRKENSYLLCAGAYTYSDLAKVGAYKNKAYKWGYFPKNETYDILKVLDSKPSEEVRLIWVGRFIEFKNPLIAIYVTRELISKGYNVSLDIVGEGEMEDQIRDLIDELQLDNQVKILGSMSPDKVRQEMLNSNIFLFTSDSNEGWGAVLNEAMNSGCAVVASHEIGSVPFLIEHKKNGLIYKSGSVKSLEENLLLLLDDNQLTRSIGKSAYETIDTLWNAKNATNNLINLCDNLLVGNPSNIEDGPCSKAEYVSGKYEY